MNDSWFQNRKEIVKLLRKLSLCDCRAISEPFPSLISEALQRRCFYTGEVQGGGDSGSESLLSGIVHMDGKSLRVFTLCLHIIVSLGFL